MHAAVRLVLASAAAAGYAAPTLAVAPPAPLDCTAELQALQINNVAQAISATGTPTITSGLTFGGMPAFLYDVDVIVAIQHTSSGELDVTLTSPSGNDITLTTDNGLAFDNIFGNTTWDDAADVDGTVPFATNASSTTDANYSSNNMTGFPLTPEEPLAALVGTNPNGTWTLTVSDDTAGNGGMLGSWALRITTLSTAPVVSAPLTAGNVTPVPIAAAAANTVTSTIVIPAGASLFDVDVTADVTHGASGTLQMNLISPAGTVVTLTSNNGGFNDDVFAGVTWNDGADPDGLAPYASNNGLTSDHGYANGVTPAALAPEEALGAFIGEDPAGTWTLRVADTAAMDGGSIDGWSLSLASASCTGIFGDGFGP